MFISLFYDPFLFPQILHINFGASLTLLVANRLLRHSHHRLSKMLPVFSSASCSITITVWWL